MSENLKRAESLFNRIMNQNGSNSGSTNSNSGNGLQSKTGGMTSSIGSSKSYGLRHHNNNNHHSEHSSNNNNHSNNTSGSSHNINNHSSHHASNHHHHKGGYKSYNGGSGNGYRGNNNNSNGMPNPNIELPKKDPVKTAEDTLKDIPADHHVLPYCWTIWHHSRAKPKQKDVEEEDGSGAAAGSPATAATAAAAAAAALSGTGSGTSSDTDSSVAVNSYLQTTNEIEFPKLNNTSETTTNIGSLEQMWACLSTLKKTYELPIGTELLIFKSGVNPVWEDPINTKGGRWVFRFSRRSPGNNSKDSDGESSMNVRKKSSLIWERLILKTMTGSIIPDSTYSEEIQDLLLNDISGLVLSVRKDEDIISIWNSNLNFNKKKQSANNKDGAEDSDKTSKKLTSFQARRIICDSILRIIRECKTIARGSDSIETLDSGSNERVYGVSFEYRLHSDNNNPLLHSGGSDKHGGGNRRYPKLYSNKNEPEA